jgi:hypothetical protein
MGFVKDATGSFEGGLLVIAAVSLISDIATLCIHIATLCIHHETELERRPALAE